MAQSHHVASSYVVVLLSFATQEHERVVSIEDMTSSVELDYTDNPTLIVPSYTHQVSLEADCNINQQQQQAQQRFVYQVCFLLLECCI